MSHCMGRIILGTQPFHLVGEMLSELTQVCIARGCLMQVTA